MTIYLTRSPRTQTPYFVINEGKTVLTVKTAHKRFPELVGKRSAQALEMLKTNPIVMVEVRND